MPVSSASLASRVWSLSVGSGESGHPSSGMVKPKVSLDELLAASDLGLYDLDRDPGELENLAHSDHPDHDPALVERMRAKLHALVEREIGEDTCLFDHDMFGTREVRRG